MTNRNQMMRSFSVRGSVNRSLWMLVLSALVLTVGGVAFPASATSNAYGAEISPEESNTEGEVSPSPEPSDGSGTEIPPVEDDKESVIEEPTEVTEDPELSPEQIMPLSAVLPSSIAPEASWSERPAVRLGGADRYETAVSITKQAYPSTADTVIIATGEIFSDSLSAAPLSAKLKAPLLPVAGTSIPASIKGELSRLRPNRIIIAGGPGSVSTSVENSLKQYSPNVVRIFGSDRYSTSVEIAKYGWQSGAKDAFMATGEGFADALSAGAAAAKLGGPVILVPGNDRSLPAATTNELSRLGVKKVHIVGGPASVSSQIESSMATSGRSVVRYGGSDRYAVSANVTNTLFDSHADAYWANGLAFADALSGAAAAGARGAALILVDSACVPSGSYSATDKLLPGSILILGGTGTLSDAVRNGNECMTRPSGVTDADWLAAQTLYAKINQERFDRNLGGLRVSDSTRGNPAQAWAAQVVKSKAQQNGSLSVTEPWVRYQVTAVTNDSSNRVQRGYDLLRTYPASTRWFYQPNAGVRGFVSVGYSSYGGQSAAVMFIGVSAAD